MPAPPRYAVFGHPIAHSLSPRLHGLFATQTGIDLQYVALDAAPDDFPYAARCFFADGGRGANVTLPHKGEAFGLADVRTPTAERIAVANVLTALPDGRIEADSNDGGGMLADLQARHGIELRGCHVLLLGAGGAARAAAFALLDAGAGTLTIANRTFGRGQALASALAQPQRVRISQWDGLNRLTSFDLIVNATSAGVQQASLALPASIAGSNTAAYDLSYGAAAQPFLDWARGASCRRVSDGLGMLIETAAASFLRWHGVRPDTEAALRALRESRESRW
ncbi:MAG: shikimate dehydrogenase [Rhodanobacteraceae bacterium]